MLVARSIFLCAFAMPATRKPALGLARSALAHSLMRREVVAATMRNPAAASGPFSRVAASPKEPARSTRKRRPASSGGPAKRPSSVATAIQTVVESSVHISEEAIDAMRKRVEAAMAAAARAVSFFIEGLGLELMGTTHADALHFEPEPKAMTDFTE